MDEISNFSHYADIAFANKQYLEALSWYRKILDVAPNDIYALSRAGAICVSMGQFDHAMDYFSRAKNNDPQNGDNHFNFANACFFKKSFADAFASYVEAEKCGCSDDVVPRLYYQMALLCSLRQDTRSALIYFQKCEESDRTGELSLSPDLISEKLKLYMMIEDFNNAEKMAAQLVAIQPTLFRNYMVYFSILMAHRNFTVAEKVLIDANQYAELTSDDKINILLQTAALYVAEGESDANIFESRCQKAIELLEARAGASDITNAQLINILMTLSEVYQKANLHEKAISCLMNILDDRKEVAPESENDVHRVPAYELTPEEIDEMIRMDTERIQELIYAGAIDGNMGAYAQIEYDENGFPVNIYDDDAFAAVSFNEQSTAIPVVNEPVHENRLVLSKDQREKILFMLLTSYLAKDKYEAAGKIADVLKHSDNKYYAYYGLYVSAFVTRKLCTDTAIVSRKYTETLAFFRNKMFADHNDSLAAIFRARLYAEDGKIEKSKEIAKLLAESDQKAIFDYIDSLTMPNSPAVSSQVSAKAVPNYKSGQRK